MRRLWLIFQLTQIMVIWKHLFILRIIKTQITIIAATKISNKFNLMPSQVKDLARQVKMVMKTYNNIQIRTKDLNRCNIINKMMMNLTMKSQQIKLRMIMMTMMITIKKESILMIMMMEEMLTMIMIENVKKYK